MNFVDFVLYFIVPASFIFSLWIVRIIKDESDF